MKSWVFILKGTPVGYENLKCGRVIWDRYQEERVIRTITLESQWDCQTPISQPMHIDYLFVFPPKERSYKGNLENTPSSAALVNYINYIAKDAHVYNPDKVVSFAVEKIVAEEPYSQITIRLVTPQKGNYGKKER